MGNTSSQPVGSQVPVSSPVHETLVGGEDASAGSEIVVSPGKRLAFKQSTQPSTKPPVKASSKLTARSSKKRSRAHDDVLEHDDDTKPRRAKRLRTKSSKHNALWIPVHSEVPTTEPVEKDVAQNTNNLTKPQAERRSPIDRHKNTKKIKPPKRARKTQEIQDADPDPEVEGRSEGGVYQDDAGQQLLSDLHYEDSIPDGLALAKTASAHADVHKAIGIPVIPTTQTKRRGVKPTSNDDQAIQKGDAYLQDAIATARKGQKVRAIDTAVPVSAKIRAKRTKTQLVQEEGPAAVTNAPPATLHTQAKSIDTDASIARSANAPDTSKRKRHKEPRQQRRSSPEVPETQPQAEGILLVPSLPARQRQSAEEPPTADEVAGKEKLPTPPESPGIREGFERVDATDQVKDWLDSQEPPTTKACAIEPNPTSSRKRKRVRHQHRDDDGEYEEASVEKADGPAPTKKRTVKQKGPNVERTEKVSLPAPLDNGPTAGAFTDTEKAVADDVFSYVVQNDPELDDAFHLKALIIDWKNVGQLKIEMQNALPCRNKIAVRKFCQRRYHPYDTGQWTEGQDDALRKAYAEFPDKWATVSEFVNRLPQDCRDRYRNIVQYGDTLVNGPWSQQEEHRLVAAVEECIETIKKNCKMDRALARDRTRLEEMVDWKTVAAKMAGRSRMRCLEKWQKLKRRGNVTELTDHVTSTTTAPTVDASLTSNTHTKKMRAVESKVKIFELGDYYDVLREIHTAINDHTKVFRDESTLWSVVATQNAGSKFSSSLRRRAYHEVFETWGWKDKKRVRKAQTTAAKAKAMARAIEKSVKKQDKELVRAYKPDIPVQLRPQEAPVRAGAANRTTSPVKAVPFPANSGRKKQSLSKEYVINSDDEGDEDITGQATERPAPNDDNEEHVVETDDEHLAHAANLPGDRSSVNVPEENDDAIIPETPRDATHVSTAATDDVAISSINSRDMPTVRNPNLGPQDFMQRCKAVGKQQHAEYTRRNHRRQQKAEAYNQALGALRSS